MEMMRFQSFNWKKVLQFLKKAFVFQKTCFKVKVLKKFKLPHKNMATSQMEGYFENLQYKCLEEPILILLVSKWNL